MDKIDFIVEEILHGKKSGIVELKNYLQLNYFDNWLKLYQVHNEIFMLTQGKDLVCSGIFIISQICIGCCKDSLIVLLKKYFEAGDLGVKIEVVKALSAIGESQMLMGPRIFEVFSIFDVINTVQFVEGIELVRIYGRQPLGQAEGRVIFDNLIRSVVQFDDFKYLGVLNTVLEYNGFLCSYIQTGFLEYLLRKLSNDDSEFLQIAVRTIGTFVENTEKAFVALLPLKIFDFLLPLIYSDEILNILLIISNLAGESENVVEILILNKGFEEIFYLLNKTSDPRMFKEVVFVLHNATIVSNKRQAEYFVGIGVIEMMRNLEEVVSEDLWKVIFRTYKNLQKHIPELQF